MTDGVDRNTVSGFGKRVTKNLEFLMRSRAEGHDVHVVTALATSLLGLIVLPHEEYRRSGAVRFPTETLADLEQRGWPGWVFHIGGSTDFADHLYHLRNSISHRRFKFSSDDRALDGVMVTFSDRKPKEMTDSWSASIEAPALHEFVRRIAALLDEGRA